MAMNKKGIIYLFLAIFFLIIFSTLFAGYHAYRYQDKQEAVHARVDSMNNFLLDLHQDLDRSAYISGFRTLLALEQYVSDEGEFFDNQVALEEAFRQVFYYGEYDGTSMPLLENASFAEYLLRVQRQADIIDVLVNVTVTNISLWQDDPWIVSISFDGLFNITDARQSAWWLYEKNFTTAIPIYGLKDPLYAVKTNGLVPNTVRNFSVPFHSFVGPNNDTSNAQLFVNGSFYHNSSLAPSFLQRFTNNLSSHPAGIEGVVSLPLLSDQGLLVFEERSVIDYSYFSANPDNSTDRCQIQNMQFSPDWFRIDEEHLELYGLDDLNWSECS